VHGRAPEARGTLVGVRDPAGTVPVEPPVAPDTSPGRGVRRARVAVAGLFLANGALFAGVVPRYPGIKAQLHLSNAAFGSAVAGYGLGALALGLVAGPIVARWGSARVAWTTTVLVAANLVLVALAPSWWALAAVLAVAGGLDSLADVAENVHALRVERGYGRSILVSLHGLWSVGAVVGGAVGAIAAGLHVPLVLHLAVVGAVLAGSAAVLSRFLLPGADRDGKPDPDEDGTAGSPAHSPADSPVDGRVGRRPARGLARTLRPVVALGLIAATAQLLEDVGATWSPLYLGGLGAGAGVAGAGFIALQATQMVSRLLGDRAVTRLGDRAVARAGLALAGTATAVALLVPGVPVTVVAFALVGLGIGTLIPASLRAADVLPGLAPGVGLGLAGSVPRVAVLAGPVAVGLVADATSLRVALVVVPLAAAGAAVLARRLPSRLPGSDDPAARPRGRLAA
jgi:MFS family permease